MAYRDADEDAGIAAARRASAKQAELLGRLASARAVRDRVGEAMAELAMSVRSEEEEVARLEGGGPRALVAKLTGRYDDVLGREVSQAEAARRTYQEREAEFARAAARVAEIEEELAELGDVQRRMEQALAAHAQFVHQRGGAPAEALAAVEAERQRIGEQDRELAAVLACGADASERLLAIIHELATPRGDDGRGGYAAGHHFSVGPDLPAMRGALSAFVVALGRIPDGLLDQSLPGIPEFDPAWEPQHLWWSDVQARRALEQISEAVTDAMLVLENRRQALGRQAEAQAARWAAMVAGS